MKSSVVICDSVDLMNHFAVSLYTTALFFDLILPLLPD